jgi:hypothetical protein
VRNKAQVHVFAAIRRVVKNLPFPIRGIDSDNGSESINAQLFRYCQDHDLKFTRVDSSRNARVGDDALQAVEPGGEGNVVAARPSAAGRWLI